MTPTWRDSVGRSKCPASSALKKEALMTGIPDSLAIALWVVGSCWALAIIAYLIGGYEEFILPLVAFGILTGAAEWVLRRNAK
jgi:hypothetical protein